jgi:hypothetical protein
MKAKDVLKLWAGWDYPDIFRVWKMDENGKFVSECFVTGEELVTGELGDHEILNFGSLGKDADGVWRHTARIRA